MSFLLQASYDMTFLLTWTTSSSSCYCPFLYFIPPLVFLFFCFDKRNIQQKFFNDTDWLAGWMTKWVNLCREYKEEGDQKRNFLSLFSISLFLYYSTGSVFTSHCLFVSSIFALYNNLLLYTFTLELYAVFVFVTFFIGLLNANLQFTLFKLRTFPLILFVCGVVFWYQCS